MRVSLKWLDELVAIDVTPERLAEMLNMSGTKVETITRLGASVAGGVVGEVLEITDHPNADSFTVVAVNVDGDATHHVVCGARNFSRGDRVPLALVGARLGDMEITEREIRGEVSLGMLCSEAEMGISEDHSGILVLPRDAPLGEDVAKVLGLDDTVFGLEITPNRGDCMGMIGIAREVAALLDSKLEVPAVDVAPDPSLESPVVVDVHDTQGCPRYVARYLVDVNVGSSPSWMTTRLMSAGFRSISNVVDVTNYVLLETGQPLHPFDADKVHDDTIVVRRAGQGERITTLDGVDRELHPDDLLIADVERPLGIAGVMGGEDSEVSSSTSKVILESAYFDPSSIAFTARRHLLRTEASARFERGADPEVLSYAAARAASLMAEVAGSRVAAAEVDEYPAPLTRPRIRLRTARTDAVLGIATPAHAQAKHLRSIGLEVDDSGGDLDAGIPSFRHDLVREIDLIEEVGRLAGYNRLPSTLPPGRLGALEREQSLDRRLRRALVTLGVSEAWTSSFMSSRDLDDLGVGDDHRTRNAVAVANPMSEEQSMLRTTLLPGLLHATAHNYAHGAEGIALFEVARVYEPATDQLPHEPVVLGAVLSGVRHNKTWRSAAKTWDFFAAKGLLEAAFTSIGAPQPRWEAVEGMPFHPTRAATVSLGGEVLGSVGELHPDVCDRFDIPEETLALELTLGAVLASVPERRAVEELPRFPPIYMDLAVVVDDSTAASAVEQTILGAASSDLTSIRLFDVYSGDQVPMGKKSLAFALELRAPDRTLTDDDAVRIRERIMDALESDMNATLRR